MKIHWVSNLDDSLTNKGDTKMADTGNLELKNILPALWMLKERMFRVDELIYLDLRPTSCFGEMSMSQLEKVVSALEDILYTAMSLGCRKPEINVLVTPGISSISYQTTPKHEKIRGHCYLYPKIEGINWIPVGDVRKNEAGDLWSTLE